MSDVQNDRSNSRRRRFRFTLRTLFALVAVVAIPLFWINLKTTEYRTEQAALTKLAPFHPAVLMMSERSWSSWSRMFGPWNRFLDRVYSVILENDASLTDSDMHGLASFSQIEGLDIRNNKITDAGLEHVGRLISLKEVDLCQISITDEGVRHLQTLRSLEDLGLRFTMATEASLDALAGLPKIRRLGLAGMPLSEKGMQKFEKFKNLQQLVITSANVSQKGLDNLRQACPNLQILVGDDCILPAQTPAQ